MRFIRSGKKSGLSDEELISRYRNSQEQDLLAELFDRYVHLVFGTSMKYMKDEDAAKDVVMEVLGKLGSDLQKHEIKFFKSWLYMVVKNACLMKLREQQRHWRNKDGIRVELEANVESTEERHQELAATEEMLGDLERAIPKLKEHQRICVELFYLQQKSYEDVSRLTGYTMLQVKSYIQNGKRNLKLMLTENAGRTT